MQGSMDGSYAAVRGQLHHLPYHLQGGHPGCLHALPCPQATGTIMQPAAVSHAHRSTAAHVWVCCACPQCLHCLFIVVEL